MADDDEAVKAIDVVAAALIRAAKPAFFRLALQPQDVTAAQAVRGRVLRERGWASPWELADGRESDPDDGRATHILAVLGELPVGACRLVFPTAGSQLPMERREGGPRISVSAAELGRIVASRSDGARGPVMAGLIGAAWIECRARGYRRMCGTVSGAMLRLYRRLGFLVQVLGDPVMLSGAPAFNILFEPSAEAAAIAMSHARDRG